MFNTDWIYDLEVYPNLFTASFKHAVTGQRVKFEVSCRINQLSDFIAFLYLLRDAGCRMVGFNNLGYDYPIIHFILNTHWAGISEFDIYQKGQQIIDTPWQRRFDNVVPAWDVVIHQIDLFKIHHFDNDARRTSLKTLEFNMGSANIEDLPYPPGVDVPLDGFDTVIRYNDHDVDETCKFYRETVDMIRFREQLTERYNRDFMNHNDTKIGKDYFVMRLEEATPGACYMQTAQGRKPRQTIRHSIRLGDVIFPYITFTEPEFQRVRDWLASQTITETKGVFTDVHATVNGFDFDFGVGGIHGSIDGQTVYTDDDHIIYDWDVASYYPNLAIANQLYPDHLGKLFCAIYKDVYEQRKQYPKGSTENAMLKLALNGVFGDSNSKYGPFYDPQYTMSITINGQLLLCLLAQELMRVPGLQMIQINTDGLTVRCPRQYEQHMIDVCKWWEDFTCLTLESAVYRRMFIRDVNNYIAEYDSGKIKRKGAFEYELTWHQNHSQRIVAKAAEAVLIHGADAEQFVKSHDNINDFMLCTKVGRADQLIISDPNGHTRQLQNITRYYVAVEGGALTKISPPVKGAKVGQWKRANGVPDSLYNNVRAELRAQGPHAGEVDADGLPWDERINTKNRSQYKERRTSIIAGHMVAPCNNIADAEWSNINYDYYIREVKKLVDSVVNSG